jgi:hypothetical protein
VTYGSRFSPISYPQVYRLLSGIALFYACQLGHTWPAALGGQRHRGCGFLLAIFFTISVEWFTDKLPSSPPRFTLLSLVTDANPNVMAGVW